MLTTAMQGGRDTSATERGKKGSANDGRASLKKSQEREQVQNERESKMGKWKKGEVRGEGSSRTGGGGASSLERRGEDGGHGGPDR